MGRETGSPYEGSRIPQQGKKASSIHQRSSSLFGSEGYLRNPRVRLGDIFSLKKGSTASKLTKSSQEIISEARPERKVDFAEIQRLVKKSTNEIIAAVSQQTQGARYILGDITNALIDTEGVDKAKEYMGTTLTSLNVPPGDQFEIWANLYKNGDHESLSLARRAASLAGEAVPFLETKAESQAGGNYVAELLVSLVEVGDNETTTFARSIVKNIPLLEKPELFSRLYRMGDEESFPLAIEAAKEAKAYTEKTGEKPSARIEDHLVKMADYALTKGQDEVVFTLLPAIENEANKANVHIQLFAKGRLESLPPLLHYMVNANIFERFRIERDLAEAGYAPALRNIRERIAATAEYDTDTRLKDLTTLHKLGDTNAAAEVANVIEREAHPEYSLDYLAEVGLTEKMQTLAIQLYTKNPYIVNARNLLKVQFDRALWEDVYGYWLKEKMDLKLASLYIRQLASYAKKEVKNKE